MNINIQHKQCCYRGDLTSVSALAFRASEARGAGPPGAGEVEEEDGKRVGGGPGAAV